MRDLLRTHYPAITLWQPWASLVAEGLKPFEFRSWPAPVRLVGQRIAIHAGARPARPREVKALLLQLQRGYRGTGLCDGAIALLERALAAPTTLPLASVLCLATLGTPIRNAELAAQLGLQSMNGFGLNDSDRGEHSNWGWPLTDIERLQPFVPARGAQGFWFWKVADG